MDLTLLLRSRSVARGRARRAAVCVLLAGATLVAPVGAATASVTGPTLTLPAPAAPPTPPCRRRRPGRRRASSSSPVRAANSCDPNPKPGAQRFGDLLTATYPGTRYGISRTCGTDPLPTSEHYDGRAVDWMIWPGSRQQKAEAQAMIGWLLARDADGDAYANARRPG